MPFPGFDHKLIASYINDNGSDVCVISKCFNCTSPPGTCTRLDPVVCVINRGTPSTAKIRITNPATGSAVFITTKRLTATIFSYGSTILYPGGNIEYSISGDLALPTNVGDYEIKVICTNDPGNAATYVFSGIAQIPDC